MIPHSKQGGAVGADSRVRHTGDGMENTQWIFVGVTAIVLIISFFRHADFMRKKQIERVVPKLDKIVLLITIAVFFLTAYVALAH
jgi:succinate dehydrogenase hydrophobic anchor subunit